MVTVIIWPFLSLSFGTTPEGGRGRPGSADEGGHRQGKKIAFSKQKVSSFHPLQGGVETFSETSRKFRSRFVNILFDGNGLGIFGFQGFPKKFPENFGAKVSNISFQ